MLLWRYIGGEFLVSFAVAFAFFFFMFFLNQLLLLAEDILQKDVPVWDVVRLIVYSLPSIIALSVPFGTLVGTLMAVGRLSADNEIVALRAGGIPLRRIFSPVLALALFLGFPAGIGPGGCQRSQPKICMLQPRFEGEILSEIHCNLAIRIV